MGKKRICQSVVAAIKGQDGKFLKLNRRTNLWHVMPDEKTIKLTAAILQRLDTDSTSGGGSNKQNGKDKNKNKEELRGGTKAEPVYIPDGDTEDEDMEDGKNANAAASKKTKIKVKVKSE